MKYPITRRLIPRLLNSHRDELREAELLHFENA